MMLVSLPFDVSTTWAHFAAASPMSAGAACGAAAAAVLYLLSRTPEFLLLTASAALYAIVPLIPVHA